MKTLYCLGLTAVLPALLLAQPIKPGATVGDFTLAGANPVTFSAAKGSINVVTFISVQCPVSNAYNDRMKALYRDYASRDVKFFFVNSNVTEAPSEVEEHARSHGFAFSVYKDRDNVIADKFGAEVTPDVFVLDAAGTVVYHGQIDDARNPANIKRQSLRAVLDALLAGKPVQVTETKAFGCTIKRVKKPS